MRCLGLEACSSRCMKACPKDAIEVGPDKTDISSGATLKTIHVKRDICDDCGKCADACYAEALTICGKDWTPEDLVKRLLQDRSFYEWQPSACTGWCVSFEQRKPIRFEPV